MTANMAIQYVNKPNNKKGGGGGVIKWSGVAAQYLAGSASSTRAADLKERLVWLSVHC